MEPLPLNQTIRAFRVGHDWLWPDWLEDFASEGKVIHNQAKNNYLVSTSHHGSQLAQTGDYIKIYPNGALMVDRLPKVWVHQDSMITHSAS